MFLVRCVGNPLGLTASYWLTNVRVGRGFTSVAAWRRLANGRDRSCWWTSDASQETATGWRGEKKRTKIYLIRVKEEPHVHTSPNSLYMIGLAWLIPSLAAGVAMRYVLPVSMDDVIFSHNGPRDTCDASSVYLNMTQQGQHELHIAAYTQNNLPGARRNRTALRLTAQYLQQRLNQSTCRLGKRLARMGRGTIIRWNCTLEPRWKYDVCDGGDAGCRYHFCSNLLYILLLQCDILPSVLWRCWLGRRKGIKTKWWGAGVATCLERDADLHMAQLMSLPLTVKSRLVVPFSYRLTRVVPDKGPLNRCVQRDISRLLRVTYILSLRVVQFLRDGCRLRSL